MKKLFSRLTVAMACALAITAVTLSNTYNFSNTLTTFGRPCTTIHNIYR